MQKMTRRQVNGYVTQSMSVLLPGLDQVTCRVEPAAVVVWAGDPSTVNDGAVAMRSVQSPSTSLLASP